MVTKKSKSFNYKYLSIILGVLFVGFLISFRVYLENTALSYEEEQELQAFRGLASSYISTLFEKEGEQTGDLTDIGVTDDGDLYADFLITKIKDHVPQSTQKARLHFQCDGKTDRVSGCAHAFWYGEEEETSEEYREKYAFYVQELERLTAAYNSSDSEEERASILEEEEALAEEYKNFFNNQ